MGIDLIMREGKLIKQAIIALVLFFAIISVGIFNLYGNRIGNLNYDRAKKQGKIRSRSSDRDAG